MAPHQMNWASIFVVIATLAITPPAAADETSEAAGFVQNFITESLRIRAAPELTGEQKDGESHRLLGGCYDAANVLRAIIGHYWDEASPSQQSRYLTVFEDYLLARYGTRFDQVVARLKVVGVTKDSSQAIVHTHDVDDDRGRMMIDWVMVRPADRWLIRDIRIGGISSVQVMREDFLSVLRANNGDIEALLAILKRQTALMRKET